MKAAPSDQAGGQAGDACYGRDHDHDHDHDLDHTHGQDDAAPTPIITPGDIVELPDDMEDLYLVGTVDGMAKVTKIAGIDHLVNLKELTLRSCLLKHMEGLENLRDLQKLELYDNQLLKMECMSTLTQLRVLDMSYNLIKSLQPVEDCPLLEEIYCAQNRLRSIEGLNGMKYLRKVCLSWLASLARVIILLC
jgi:Leucine-rich repeat (LRR) protein